MIPHKNLRFFLCHLEKNLNDILLTHPIEWQQQNVMTTTTAKNQINIGWWSGESDRAPA
jgi:hypothetical protein